MTREDVIFCEKTFIGETNCIDCKFYGRGTCQSRRLHKMAIEALEQEPKADNRVKTELNRVKTELSGIKAELSRVKTELEQEPKTGWIPVSERLPEKDGFYIATLDGEICGEDEPFCGMAEFENGKWVDDKEDYQCVIAWMPLPPSYQGK